MYKPWSKGFVRIYQGAIHDWPFYVPHRCMAKKKRKEKKGPYIFGTDPDERGIPPKLNNR